MTTSTQPRADRVDSPITPGLLQPRVGSEHPRRSTVLVVDDDAAVRLFHRSVLERHGYHVITASGGPEALAALDEHDISLVLLDARMPGMSGDQVVRAIRLRAMDLPVVMITAADATDECVSGLENGADDYLGKPIAPAELGARVFALLRGRQAVIDRVTGAADAQRIRAEVRSVLSSKAFRVVFQPIVELASRQVVAYEALTRFDDGERPDIRFSEADRVGLGEELALATLDAAIQASAGLPLGADLHLNISHELLEHPLLAPLLNECDRPLVLELTEYEPIDDYERVARALGALGHEVRLAIDDAGAGFASMKHILGLGPDEVKLDRHWVTGVDTDPTRQALIAGLVSFATSTDTVLIAEGIETEAEARRLIELDVRFGQGFHLGRPAEATEWPARPA